MGLTIGPILEEDRISDSLKGRRSKEEHYMFETVFNSRIVRVKRQCMGRGIRQRKEERREYPQVRFMSLVVRREMRSL